MAKRAGRIKTARTAIAALTLTLSSVIAVAQDVKPDDRFIAGYAAAVLEREFSIAPSGLEVQSGVVRLRGRGFGQLEEQQLIKSLSAIRGVSRVEIIDALDTHKVEKSAPGVFALTSAPEPAPADVPIVRVPAHDGTDDTAKAGPAFYLSTGRLFEPLLADPRWPHFFASYNRYLETGTESGGKQLRDIGSVGFGETIALARQQFRNDIRVEGGIQAAVFAVFNLGAESKDLVNADYFVGPYIATRFNDFSILTRLYHQSSHLGDEYLLGNSVDRINLSYEAIDLIASYELPAGLRVYGGAGYLFDQEPADFKPWMFQYGAEFRSPWTFGEGGIRPVAAIDIKQKEEADYNADLSIRAGLQFEDPRRLSQKMLILLEYYKGQSPNGQFFSDDIEFIGLGLHFYF